MSLLIRAYTLTPKSVQGNMMKTDEECGLSILRVNRNTVIVVCILGCILPNAADLTTVMQGIISAAILGS